MGKNTRSRTHTVWFMTCQCILKPYIHHRVVYMHIPWSNTGMQEEVCQVHWLWHWQPAVGLVGRTANPTADQTNNWSSFCLMDRQPQWWPPLQHLCVRICTHIRKHNEIYIIVVKELFMLWSSTVCWLQALTLSTESRRKEREEARKVRGGRQRTLNMGSRCYYQFVTLRHSYLWPAPSYPHLLPLALQHMHLDTFQRTLLLQQSYVKPVGWTSFAVRI